MTTIISLKTKTSVFLSGDSQTSEGHLRLPFETPKVEVVGSNILIASAGSVGNCQQVLSRALKNIYISKVLTESYDFYISPKELNKEIAEFNFEMPLSHKEYNPFGFIVVGNHLGKNTIEAIGDDASTISIPTYYAMGSGRELALSMLNESYSEDMSDEQAIALIYNIFSAVSKSDIFTNDLISVMGIVEKTGEIFNGLPYEEKPKQDIKDIKEEVKTEGSPSV